VNQTSPPTIKRRFIVCPHWHSPCGETFVFENLVAWLDFAEVPLVGFDLSPMLNFSRFFPGRVKPLTTNGLHPDREQLLGMLHEIEETPGAPVILADFPYHKNKLNSLLFEGLPTLQIFSQLGIRMTFLVFMDSDRLCIDSVADMVRRFQRSADYLLIDNPGSVYRFNSEPFKKAPLYNWFQERATPTFHVPECSHDAVLTGCYGVDEEETFLPKTLEDILKLPGLSLVSRAEINRFRDEFFTQCEEHAHLLLPDASLIQNRFYPEPPI